jgi:hypothetical protein
MAKGKWGTNIKTKAYCNHCGVEQTALGRTITPFEVRRGTSRIVDRRSLCDDCKVLYESDPFTTLTPIIGV